MKQKPGASAEPGQDWAERELRGSRAAALALRLTALLIFLLAAALLFAADDVVRAAVLW